MQRLPTAGSSTRPIFHRFVCTDDEFAALDAGYLDRQARLFPLLLQELPKEASYEGPQPTDTEVLAQIDAPVLVLLGRQTRLDQMDHRVSAACRPARRRRARPGTP